MAANAIPRIGRFLRMAHVFLLLAIALANVAGADADTVIATDFAVVSKPVLHDLPEQRERAKGMLPDGWRDDSAWAKVWVNYQPLEEEAKRFVRMEVSRVESGQAQLAFDLPVLNKQAFYRLELQARTLAGADVQVAVRNIGKPYSMLWSARPQLNSDWSNAVIDFAMDPCEVPCAFYINLPKGGTADFAKVTLSRLNRDELVAEIHRRHPDGGPRNLLSVSQFSRGLPVGWHLDRDVRSSDVRLGQSPDTATISGQPALEVESLSQRPAKIWCGAFSPVDPTQPHAASCYIKGDGDIELAVFTDGRQIALQKQSVVAGEWTRISTSFQPPLVGGNCSFSVTIKGKLALDAFQISPGERAISYQPAFPSEVVLSIPTTETAPQFVQFDDEEPVVRWLVISPRDSEVLKHASLRAKVTNVYGDEKPLPIAALEDSTEGTLHYAVFPKRGLGTFRIEAWVEDSAGRSISAVSELVVNRVRRPHYWAKDAPTSPFGVHVAPNGRDSIAAKAIGFNWVRVHNNGVEATGWASIEKAKGEFKIDDTPVKTFRKDRLMVLGELGTAPRWATAWSNLPADKKVNGYFAQYMQPKSLDDFANYVERVVQHYRDDIGAWYVWNEPWQTAWWAVGIDETKIDGGKGPFVKSATPQADYVRLTRRAYDAAKKIDPTVTIVGLNTSNSEEESPRLTPGRAWTEGFVHEGGLSFCDAVDYHQYTNGVFAGPGDLVEKAHEYALGPALSADADKRVWMTEGSADMSLMNVGLYKNTTPGRSPDRNIDAADGIARYVISLLGNRVEKVFLYAMSSYSHFGFARNYQCLVNEDGTLHPSAAAFSHLTYALEDHRFVQRADLNNDTSVFVFAPIKNGDTIAVISVRPSGKAFQIVRPDAGQVTVSDLFGNPIDLPVTIDRTLCYVASPLPPEQLLELLKRATP